MASFEIVESRGEWDNFVCDNSGHPLQLWGWGEMKSMHGPWTPTRIFFTDGGTKIGGAQILTRKLPRPFGAMMYVPRGPVVNREDDRKKILTALAGFAKTQKGVVIKIEPDWTEMPDGAGKWRRSKNDILLARTLVLNLKKTEAELQTDMTKKTRQYIRKSENSGVTVRRITKRDDIEKAMDIYKLTAKRANFALHADKYYYDLHDMLGDASQIYLAEINGQPLSFLWLAVTPQTAFELYGGVNDRGQELRANYVLKWRAIVEQHKASVELYDMNGLLNDGVSNFKLGFSQVETQWVGAWDLPLSPLYSTWETMLPAGKRLVQKLKNR